MGGSKTVRDCAALLLITLAAYWPALHAGFIWDDETYVLNNPALRSVDGLGTIWLEPGALTQYYPLYYTSFWIEYQLWADSPTGYHVVNVLLHAMNAAVLFLLLRRLGVPWAWLAAAIFAVHPVHVESVAWISERKNTLSGFFYLLAALAYTYFEPLEPRTGDKAVRERSWAAYGLMLAAFVAALLSKTATLSLPVALLLILWWKRGHIDWWRSVGPLVPMFALAVGAALLTWSVEHAGLAARAVGVGIGLDWSERLLVAGRAVWFYLGKLVLPLGLVPVYPGWEIASGQWAQWVWPGMLLVALMLLSAARQKCGRGPLVALVLFIVALLPTLGIVNFGYMQYSFVADHFVYLPSTSIIALLVGAVHAAAQRIGQTQASWTAPLGLALLAVLAWGTWQYTHVFRGSETLWRYTLYQVPDSWVAHASLGVHLARTERPDEAIPHLERAIELKPTNRVAWNGLAGAYEKLGERDEAIATYERALASDPRDAYAHFNLGVLLTQQRDLERAMQHYAAALKHAPSDSRVHAAAHTNLGRTLADQTRRHMAAGRYDEAVSDLKQAVTEVPDLAAGHMLLGRLLLQLGRPSEAVAHLELAARAMPANTALARELDAARASLAEAEDLDASPTTVPRTDPEPENRDGE